MSKFNSMIVNAQHKMTRAKAGFKAFMSSERGVSNVVATIIILLIVVLIIGVFWDQLKVWLDGMMAQIFGTQFAY